MSQPKIYLDHAAATPVSDAVMAIMLPYYQDKFYNPSATYLSASNVRHDIDKARAVVAKALGARPTEIIFTAGGTEANNLAIHGVMKQFPDGNMIVSSIEHDSVLEPAKNYQTKLLNVDESGRVLTDKLQLLIDKNTVLVSVMYANNEIGTVQDIIEVAKIIKSERENRTKIGNNIPIYLHTDACQAANYLMLALKQKGVDMMTINGGKIYGPKQSGALFVRTGVNLSSQIQGGGQENNLRSGTENVANIIGFADALGAAQTTKNDESARLKILQDYTQTKLLAKIPKIIINGTPHITMIKNSVQPKNIAKSISAAHRLPNFIHLTIPGNDNERLMMLLDDTGFQCAVGSACSASSDEPSHVLTAVGISDKDAQASLRISMGRATTSDNMDKFVDQLAKIVAQ